MDEYFAGVDFHTTLNFLDNLLVLEIIHCPSSPGNVFIWPTLNFNQVDGIW